MLTEEAIYKMVVTDFTNSSNNLVARANELGGYDNITVVIIKND